MSLIRLPHESRERFLFIDFYIVRQTCLAHQSATDTKDDLLCASLFQEKQPELVLLDIIMPDIDGLEILRHLKKADPNGIIIMLSGVKTIKMVVDAMKLGAEDYIAKPFDINEIKIVLQKVRF